MRKKISRDDWLAALWFALAACLSGEILVHLVAANCTPWFAPFPNPESGVQSCVPHIFQTGQIPRYPLGPIAVAFVLGLRNGGVLLKKTSLTTIKQIGLGISVKSTLYGMTIYGYIAILPYFEFSTDRSFIFFLKEFCGLLLGAPMHSIFLLVNTFWLTIPAGIAAAALLNLFAQREVLK